MHLPAPQGGHTDAVVQPLAVVVKAHHALVAVPAVLAALVDVRAAEVARRLPRGAVAGAELHVVQLGGDAGVRGVGMRRQNVAEDGGQAEGQVQGAQDVVGWLSAEHCCRRLNTALVTFRGTRFL